MPSEDTRLRYRYLDLRDPALQANLMLRDRVTLETRQYLHEQGFVHLETPILTRSTPEGARDYLVPSRIHRGSFYALPQSPQLFKQSAWLRAWSGTCRSRAASVTRTCGPIASPSSPRSTWRCRSSTRRTSSSSSRVCSQRLYRLVDIEVEVPFPRLDWTEAMRRFGTDRPDLRFGMEIVDLTDLLAESGFRGFQAVAADGGVIRAIAVPGAAGASRKQVDGWVEVARAHGALGALTLKSVDGEVVFQVKGALNEDEMRAVADRLGLEEGSLALIVAAGEPVAAAALGALRNRLARDFDLIPEGLQRFAWVQRFPLFEWSEEEQRWSGTHHPFTAPDPEGMDRLESDPGSVSSRSYDVVLNGLELGGGSIRIHDSDLQSRVFRVLGIDEQEASERFGFFLEALRYGAPPHGGIALGLDRIVMLMAGASSLREVIAFPKTTSALCLMTDAPASVDSRQLEELGIQPIAKGEAETGSDESSE